MEMFGLIGPLEPVSGGGSARVRRVTPQVSAGSCFFTHVASPDHPVDRCTGKVVDCCSKS